MRSFITTITAALVLFYHGTVIGQQAATQQLSCNDPSSTLLWKINGNQSRVYLFGSIHVGKADFYPLPAVIESAYHNSQHVVFEIDPRDAADPAAMFQIQSKAMLQDGQSLKDMISEPVMNDLVKTLNNLGLPAEGFMGFQPWFISMLLSNLQVAALGYLPQQGIEQYLVGEKPPQAQILELESLQQQIGFLQELNGEAFLYYTLQDFDEGKEKLEQLINAWRCADRGELKDLLFNDLETAAADDPEMKKLMEMLFFERNKKMSGVITDYLENGNGDYFVTVGAGHLIGDRSIIDLLDDRYKVVNIKKSY